jgi:hypothetical protein
MAKHQTKEEPTFEEFIRPRIDKRHRIGRRAITLWLDEEIIQACRPHPGTALREWIEGQFWLGHKKD